jgi:hypothetical protein
MSTAALIPERPLLPSWRIDQDLTRHPRSCVACRESERNDLLLDNNHAPGMVAREGICMAQHLTRNHVRYGVDRITKGYRDRFGQLTGRPLTGEQRENEAGHLQRSVTRAAELWSHTADTGWLDDARALLAREHGRAAAPEHHAVPATEEGALW